MIQTVEIKISDLVGREVWREGHDEGSFKFSATHSIEEFSA